MLAAALVAWLVAFVGDGFVRTVKFTVVGSPEERARDSFKRTPFPAVTKQLDDAVAWPSYYFGPVYDDIRYGCSKIAEDIGGALRVGRDTSFQQVDLFLVGRPVWLGIWTGMTAGALLGVVIAIPLAVAYLIVTGVTVLVAYGSCLARRMLQRLLMTVRKVRLACPDCGETVRPWPVYICSKPKCTRLHRDIRSGPYGVRRRTCKCDQSLPTFLPDTARRLQAKCPNLNCPGELLPEGFGVTGEAIWALAGGRSSGKSQLLYSLILAVIKLTESRGGQVTFPDDTRERLESIKNNLTSNERRPIITPTGTPRAYVLRVSLKSVQRLIYVFDPAGEADYVDRTYLNKATAHIFVIDPLSRHNVERKFTPDRWAELEPQRGSSPSDAYAKLSGRMRELGHKHVPAPLAIVVSKSDLLAEARAGGLAWKNTRELVTGQEGLSMGSQVNSVKKNFRKVRFFTTVTGSAENGLDDGVLALASWLMRSEGIPVRA